MIITPCKVWNLSFKLFFSFFFFVFGNLSWKEQIFRFCNIPGNSRSLTETERCDSNTWGEKSAVALFLLASDPTFQTFQRHPSLVETRRFRQPKKTKKHGSGQALDDTGSRVRAHLAHPLCRTQSVPSSSPLSCALCTLPLSSLNGCPFICRSLWPIQRLSCTDLRPAGKDNCTRCQQGCYMCLGAPLE